jgi:hypothetical protein
MQQTKWSEAEPLLEECVEIRRAIAQKTSNEVSPTSSAAARDLTDALEQMVQLYTQWGKPDEANRWRQQLGEAKQR